MSPRFDQFNAVIAAWKRRDIAAVLAAMTDDIVWHTAVAAAPPLVGKAAAGEFLQKFSTTIAEVRWRLFDHAETLNTLFVEGVDEFDSTAGVTVVAPYAGVIDFRGALISGWRDYLDFGTMNAIRKGGAVPPHVAQLIDRIAL